MKLVLQLIQVSAVLALVALVTYFAKVREVYEGRVVYEEKGLGDVTVRLYNLEDIEKWLANDFVAGWLHWKNHDQELEDLVELCNLCNTLLANKKAEGNSATYAAHQKRNDELENYRKLFVGIEPVTFPKDLFRNIRREIPNDLYIPAKSLFVGEKKHINKKLKGEFLEVLHERLDNFHTQKQHDTPSGQDQKEGGQRPETEVDAPRVEELINALEKDFSRIFQEYDYIIGHKTMLFKSIRESFSAKPAGDFLHAIESSFDKIAVLKKEVFFKILEARFIEISQHNINQIQNKFKNEDWDQHLDYVPHYDREQAIRFFVDYGNVDAIAAKLQQFAVNDEEVQHLAPAPLMEKKTDKGGRVRFSIGRFFNKAFDPESKFSIAATYFHKTASQDGAGAFSTHSLAWLKTVNLDEKARIPLENTPFFPPKQRFTLSNANSTSELLGVLQLADDSKSPQVLKPPPQENMMLAIHKLVHKSLIEHGHGGHDDGHGGHGDGHGGHGDEHGGHD